MARARLALRDRHVGRHVAERVRLEDDGDGLIRVGPELRRDGIDELGPVAGLAVLVGLELAGRGLGRAVALGQVVDHDQGHGRHAARVLLPLGLVEPALEVRNRLDVRQPHAGRVGRDLADAIGLVGVLLRGGLDRGGVLGIQEEADSLERILPLAGLAFRPSGWDGADTAATRGDCGERESSKKWNTHVLPPGIRGQQGPCHGERAATRGKGAGGGGSARLSGWGDEVLDVHSLSSGRPRSRQARRLGPQREIECLRREPREGLRISWEFSGSCLREVGLGC